MKTYNINVTYKEEKYTKSMSFYTSCDTVSEAIKKVIDSKIVSNITDISICVMDEIIVGKSNKICDIYIYELDNNQDKRYITSVESVEDMIKILNDNPNITYFNQFTNIAYIL